MLSNLFNIRLYQMLHPMKKHQNIVEYLVDYFKYSLTMKAKPMNFSKFLDDIYSYVFIELKAARRWSCREGMMKSLEMKSFFSLHMFKCVISLRQIQPIKDCFQFKDDDPMSSILLFRLSNGKNYFLQFYSYSNSIDVTFNDVWIEETFSPLDLVIEMDIDDLSHIVRI